MQGDLIRILLYSIAIFMLGLIAINLAEEYFIKYMLFSIIMSGTTIITCIGCLRRLKSDNIRDKNSD